MGGCITKALERDTPWWEVQALEGQTARSARPLLVEIVVIVVSIVLAFGLDAWWDGIAEGRQLREQLGSVEAEVRGNPGT